MRTRNDVAKKKAWAKLNAMFFILIESLCCVQKVINLFHSVCIVRDGIHKRARLCTQTKCNHTNVSIFLCSLSGACFGCHRISRIVFFSSSFRSVIVPFLRVTARHSSRSHYIRLGGMDFVVPGDGALFSFEAETKFILIELCGPLSVRLSYQSCFEDCFVFVAHATQMSRHNVHCTRTEHKHVSVPLSPL